MAVRELDIPARLPVDHLSVSSISTFLECPTRWRRRYIEREYEAPAAAMILGSAVGAAEGHAYQAQIDGELRPSTQDVLDLFAAEFDERAEREAVDWGDEKPGQLKDVGVLAVKAYEQTIVPSVNPVSVEREFSLEFADVEWTLRGYLDLEQKDGGVDDLKVRKSRLSVQQADSDLQPTAYLLARRAEGNPAPVFRYQTMVKVKTPYAEVVPTVRTDRQLDSFVNRVYGIAAEMQWRLETENWDYAAPGSWRCSERFCGFWGSCPGGGLR